MKELDKFSNKELALAARRAAEKVLDNKNRYAWSTVSTCACGFLLKELFPTKLSWHLLPQANEISRKAAIYSKRFPAMSRERGAEVLLELAEELEQIETLSNQEIPPNSRAIVLLPS